MGMIIVHSCYYQMTICCTFGECKHALYLWGYFCLYRTIKYTLPTQLCITSLGYRIRYFCLKRTIMHYIFGVLRMIYFCPYHTIKYT